MSRKLGRWLNSRKGKRIAIGVVSLFVILGIIGQFTGWWVALGDMIAGTAVLPIATYPAPDGGYTCLPSCADGISEPHDGQFLIMSGGDMHSFGGATTVVWISIPGDYATFELSIFDGDTGKDNAGNLNSTAGNWDQRTAESIYTLYADPLRNGSETAKIGEWRGNAENPLSDDDTGWTASATTMPNNAWYTLNMDTSAAARGPSGHYFYRLVVQHPGESQGYNTFKLRSNGYLSTGLADLVDANFGITGMLAQNADAEYIFPQFKDFFEPGPSTYTGEWRFYLYLPEEEGTLEFWDGDFDFGSHECDVDNPDPTICNTRDAITQEIPNWAAPSITVPQGTHAKGIPSDDYAFAVYRREPTVRYQIIDPFGEPVYTNDKPSGSEEWKRFVISSDPNTPAHFHKDKIGPGFYTWHIQGLDLHNFVWIRTNYEIAPICEDGPCAPPPVCDATCPRTIGYWKNNIKKTLEGKTNGVQETPESIEAALRLIALESELYRHGIDVLNPQPIADPVPLTLEEAHMILQRDKKTYPGDNKSSQTMLARALQQNLATWLNWGSGKICDFTVISLPGGTFDGRIEDALTEAQTIILNHDDAQMERAKDIGDKINNGLLGEDAGNSTCQDYNQVMPSDRQPPKYDEMPKAPKPDVPDQVDTPPQPDPDTCQGVRTNTYGVENPTNNPFYGIKFEYKSGTEVKNGDFDEFAVVLTQEQVQAMTSFQMEAKAGQNVGMVTLEGCDFTSPLPCGGEPVQDENRFFAFYFMGAQDNGDGTFTLRFQVQNMTDKGLSHATIGLPEGAVPPSSGNYESKICP